MKAFLRLILCGCRYSSKNFSFLFFIFGCSKKTTYICVMKMIKNNVAGVYGIYELAGENVLYVGSSYDLDFRFYEHKRNLTNETHPNDTLMRLCLKYGIENLEFRVLFYCDPKYLILREMQIIKLFNPICNIVKEGYKKVKHKSVTNDKVFNLIKSYITEKKVKTVDISKKIKEKTGKNYTTKRIGVVLNRMGYVSFQDSKGERFHILESGPELENEINLALNEIKHFDSFTISDVVSRLSTIPKSTEIKYYLIKLGYENKKGIYSHPK